MLTTLICLHTSVAIMAMLNRISKHALQLQHSVLHITMLRTCCSVHIVKYIDHALLTDKFVCFKRVLSCVCMSNLARLWECCTALHSEQENQMLLHVVEL
jgi:hypothetical protein